MDRDTLLVFTREGLGQAPVELQKQLAVKFLALINDSGMKPGKIVFYTEGVKLVCRGSPVLDMLHELQAKGVELLICQTCLDYFGLSEAVEVGIVGGMPDIIEAMSAAKKVISV